MLLKYSHIQRISPHACVIARALELLDQKLHRHLTRERHFLGMHEAPLEDSLMYLFDHKLRYR